MSVNKLTLPSKENSVQRKINEIIDNLGGAITNYVTTDTAQDISGRKTFLGEKAIYFKQSATTNKLGFTLYNPSNTELGAFEYRPNTISSKALLNVNCPYTGDYVGFRYWGTAVNVVAPKVATAGTYYIPTHITDGNTTVTANNQGVVDISSLLPSDISTILHNTANTAINTESLSILGLADTPYSVAIGSHSSTTGQIAYATAIGYYAQVNSANSIQIGYGTNSTANSLYVGFWGNTDTHYNWQLLNGTTGLIPDARLSSNIARTSAIPTALSDLAVSAGNNITILGDTISATDTTYSDFTGADSITAGTSGLVPAPSAGDEDKILTGGGTWESVNTVIGYTPVNKSGDTMTGGLVSNVSASSLPYIVKFNDVDFDIPPSGNWYSGIEIQDAAGRRMGRFEYSYNADGSHYIGIADKKNSSEGVYSLMRTGFLGNGSAYCSFPNTTCVDGQWIDSQQELISSAPSMNSSTALEYRITLPNDGHIYEVMVGGRISTGSTSGNFVYLTMRGNQDSYSRYCCGVRTRTASTMLAIGTVIVTASYVASGSKNLTVPRSTNYNGTLDVLNVFAYRRIGTNS